MAGNSPNSEVARRIPEYFTRTLTLDPLLPFDSKVGKSENSVMRTFDFV
jgi:hypothetical protein